MSQEILEPQVVPELSTPARASWIVPAIIGSALLMQSLESTIMSNALPSVARALGEQPLRLNLAITVFLLASAVFLPVSGWLADKYGAKRIFIASMVLFAVSSAGCGLANSLPQLLVARALQGASAAMMTPVARLVLLRTTPKADLVAAMSVFTMPAMIGPVCGPLLGGFIVSYLDWRWIFFINLPVAVIAIVLVRAFVPNIQEQEVSPVDWRGVLLIGAAAATLVIAFESLAGGGLAGWLVASLFLTSLVFFGLYWRHARGNRHAIIDLAVFRRPTFNAATTGGAFLRLSIGAMPFLLAMLLQVGFGLSAFKAGLLTFLSAAGALVMKAVAPPILRRFGFRRVLLVNGLIVAASFMVYALITPGMAHWLIMALLTTSGFFRSLQFTAISSLAFAEIEQAEMTRASTTSSMVQQLVTSMGVGLAAAFVHLVQQVRGEDHTTWQAVSPAFIAVGLASLVSMIWMLRLPLDAGDELSGRRAS